jgi:glycerol-3-phosphate dehydrogenase (NAD(P)+)
LSVNIKPCFKIELALEKADIVFFVVPSNVMEHTVSFAARSIKNKAILVNVSKGLDPDTLCSMTSLIAKHVRPALKSNVTAISGPAVANQIALHQYTAMNVTGHKRSDMKKVMEVRIMIYKISTL